MLNSSLSILFLCVVFSLSFILADPFLLIVCIAWCAIITGSHNICRRNCARHAGCLCVCGCPLIMSYDSGPPGRIRGKRWKWKDDNGAKIRAKMPTPKWFNFCTAKIMQIKQWHRGAAIKSLIMQEKKGYCWLALNGSRTTLFLDPDWLEAGRESGWDRKKEREPKIGITREGGRVLARWREGAGRLTTLKALIERQRRGGKYRARGVQRGRGWLACCDE